MNTPTLPAHNPRRVFSAIFAVLAVVGLGAWLAHKASPVAVSMPAADAAPAQAPLRELTRAPGVGVRVSSEVGNGKDFPDHLIDGNPETAWQSKTGELTTAWVDIDLPAGVTVHKLGLIPGFAKTTPKVDLFTGNVRVTEIDALYNDKVVAHLSLNAEDRSMQYASILLPSGAGGTLHLAIRAIVPGSNKTWK